jgi:hypothetical protein
MEKTMTGRIEKCFFPNNRCVLAAHDANGKFVVGLVRNPKNRLAWFRSPVTRRDRADIEAAIKEIKP